MPAVDEVWEIVCATGHRPQHLGKTGKEWTRKKLLDAAVWCRDERGTKVGISGFAVGVDLMWADAVIQAGLILGAYIPCPQQADPWRAHDRQEWKRLRALADPAYSRVFADRYSVQVLHERDQAMLDTSKAVVCVWRPEKREGGTWGTIVKANKPPGMPGVHLDPGRQKVRLGLPSIEEVR